MIKQIAYEDIPENILYRAACEQIPFPKKNAQYFGYFYNGVLVGCVSVTKYKNKTGKLTSSCVLKKYRGKGIYTELNKKALEYAKEQGIKLLKLNSFQKAVNIHLKAGATIEKQLKTVTSMVYNLEDYN